VRHRASSEHQQRYRATAHRDQSESARSTDGSSRGRDEAGFTCRRFSPGGAQSRAHIVADDARFPYVVQMGSQVTYIDDVAGRTHRVSVVYPAEANIDQNRVSVLTPVGAALIGMSPAQCIHWRDPDGRTRILTVFDVGSSWERW